MTRTDLILAAFFLSSTSFGSDFEAAAKHKPRPAPHRPHRPSGGGGFQLGPPPAPGDNDPSLSNGGMCDSGTCFCNGEPITGGTLCQ